VAVILPKPNGLCKLNSNTKRYDFGEITLQVSHIRTVRSIQRHPALVLFVMEAEPPLMELARLTKSNTIGSDSVGKSGLLQSQFMSITSFGGLYRAEALSYVHNASKAILNHLTRETFLNGCIFTLRWRSALCSPWFVLNEQPTSQWALSRYLIAGIKNWTCFPASVFRSIGRMSNFRCWHSTIARNGFCQKEGCPTS
jgi:hypothetical protein